MNDKNKNGENTPRRYVGLDGLGGAQQPAQTRQANQQAPAPQADDTQWTASGNIGQGYKADPDDGLTGMERFVRKARALQDLRIQKFQSQADEDFYDETGAFNPRRVAGLANSSRLMSERGQINASNNGRDLGNQIADFFLKRDLHLQSLNAQERWQIPGLSAQRRASFNGAVAKAAGTRRGIERIAQRLSDDSGPIRPLMDFTSQARDLLKRRDLKPGTPWFPSKDLGRGLAWVLGQRGGTVKSEVRSAFLRPQYARIQSVPTIQFWDEWVLDYDGMARIGEILREEMALTEARVVMQIITAASDEVNDPITAPGKLDTVQLERARKVVESDRMVVEKFVMMRQRMSDFITEIAGEVDMATQRELLMTGVAGHFLGAAIMVMSGGGIDGTSGTAVFDPQQVFAMAPPQHVGYLGIAQEVTVEPIDERVLGINRQGLFGHAMIAPIVVEAKNIARIDVTG